MKRFAQRLVLCLGLGTVSVLWAGQSQNEQLAAGASFTCTVKEGGAQCWGAAAAGELGEKNLFAKDARGEPSWVPTLGVNAGVTAVSAGTYHACAIVSGGVKCWGSNAQGQLGHEQTGIHPAQWVSGLEEGAGVDHLTAGGLHTCAANSTAKWVRCWGNNGQGQLGDGSHDASSVPVAAPLPASVKWPIVQLAAGGSSTCLIDNVFSMFCWGDNTYGQISAIDVAELPQPMHVFSNVMDMSIGPGHACHRETSGKVYCAGRNQYGQIGLGSKSNFARGVVVGLPAGVMDSVSVGASHSCATDGGKAYCWGNSEFAQAGPPSLAGRLTPVQVMSANAWQLSLGQSHACNLASNGALSCWGLNDLGQAGGTPAYAMPPSQVNVPGMPAMNVDDMFLGDGHTCVSGHTVQGNKPTIGCWGSNRSAQIPGAPATVLDTTTWYGAEYLALPLAETRIHADAGPDHLCWILEYRQEGDMDWFGDVYTLRCAGDNGNGQRGYIDSDKRVLLDDKPFLDTPSNSLQIVGHPIATGKYHSCIVVSQNPWAPDLSGDNIWCWGRNNAGQQALGADNQIHYEPRKSGVNPPPGHYENERPRQLVAGSQHTCARLNISSGVGGGRVFCWGSNSVGQLGTGLNMINVEERFVRSKNGYGDFEDIYGFTKIVSGTVHTCGLVDKVNNGFIEPYCWGGNYSAQLGRHAPLGDIPSTENSFFADNLPTVGDSIDIAAGDAHTCVVSDDGGQVKCWGSNTTGQSGQPRPQKLTVPKDVFGINAASRVFAGVSHSCALRTVGGLERIWCWGSGLNGRLGNGVLGYFQVPNGVLPPVEDDMDGDGVADPYDECNDSELLGCGLPEEEEEEEEPPVPFCHPDDPTCTMLFRSGFEESGQAGPAP